MRKRKSTENTPCPNSKNNPNCGQFKKLGVECRSCSKFKIKEIHACKQCGKEFEHRIDSSNQYCTKQCYYDSELSHTYKLTKEQEIRAVERRRTTLSKVSDDEKLRRSQWMSMQTSLRTTTPEWKEAQSLKLTTKIADGVWQPFNNHKNGYYLTIDGRHEYYASSWELGRMMQLDSEGKTWTKKHKIKIPYCDADTNRNYVPDILVDGKYLEEIKPTALLTERLNILKINAGFSFCSENNLEFRIITDVELGGFIQKAIEYHEQHKQPK